MENILIALVSILSLLILGLFTIIAIFVYKYIKLKEKSTEPVVSFQDKVSPEVLEALNVAKTARPNIVGEFCIDHPDLYAKGTCAISNEAYCELCLTKEEEIKVARKFLDLLLDTEWEELYMVNNTVIGADKLNELFKLKKQMWHDDQIPMVAHKQFKLNVEDDKIETYTLLKSRVVDKDQLLEKFKFLKN
jgi:hypothetical protein